MDVPDEARLADALVNLALVMFTDRSLSADLERLSQVVCRLIPNCSGASVSMLVDGRPSTVAASDRVAMQLDLVQYDRGEGPCIAALTGEGIRIGYLPADERFPHFAVGAADQRVLSVLSTPAIDRGSVVGSLNIYSRVRDAFDERDRDAATIIAAEIANALRKSTVLSAAMNIRDRLQEEHDEVVLVARAQGVLMSIHECSSAQARDLIRHAAEGNNESLIVVAERILASMSPDLEEVGERSPERGDAH